MQSKKEKWLEAWDLLTQKGYNAIRTASILLQNYSEATRDGEFYTTSFFTQSYHTKSHIIPVNNTLNNTGYDNGYYNYHKSEPLIRKLLSILKAEMGNTQISEEGDLWAILEAIKEKTGVDYNNLSSKKEENEEVIEKIDPEVKKVPKKSKEDIQAELLQAIKEFRKHLVDIKNEFVFERQFVDMKLAYYKHLNAITQSTSIKKQIKNYNELLDHHRSATTLSATFVFTDLSKIMYAMDQLEKYEEETNSHFKDNLFRF